MSNFFSSIPVFVGEVKAELTKVAWPTRKELVGATWIVIIVTAILTAYIGTLDFFLTKAVSMVMK
jgi:preprotein translocase subunit SecE